MCFLKGWIRYYGEFNIVETHRRRCIKRRHYYYGDIYTSDANTNSFCGLEVHLGPETDERLSEINAH